MADITRIGGRHPPQTFIEEWMDKRGLNQAQLAARMDTSAATVSRKLNAKRKMKVEDLAWFADALDIQPEDLFHHPDRPTADELLRRLPENQRVAAFTLITNLRNGTDG